MDPAQQELAALHALRLLEADEEALLQKAAAHDTELRLLVGSLERTAAELCHVAPEVPPPAHLKAAIMDQVHERNAARQAAASGSSSRLAWAMAAGFAVASLWLLNERTQLSRQVMAVTRTEAEVRQERDASRQKQSEVMGQLARLASDMEALRKRDANAQAQLAAFSREIETLRSRDVFSQMQIATLQSTLAAYKQGVAVVVWDSEKHTGVLKLEKMPPVQTGRDYQLWVVDPKNPEPVNAGVVKVDARGFAKVDFKPAELVTEAAKFALSVEKKGGAPKNAGPIILLGP